MTRKHTASVERQTRILAGARLHRVDGVTIYLEETIYGTRLLMFKGARLDHTSLHASEALAISAARARIGRGA